MKTSHDVPCHRKWTPFCCLQSPSHAIANGRHFVALQSIPPSHFEPRSVLSLICFVINVEQSCCSYCNGIRWGFFCCFFLLFFFALQRTERNGGLLIWWFLSISSVNSDGGIRINWLRNGHLAPFGFRSMDFCWIFLVCFFFCWLAGLGFEVVTFLWFVVDFQSDLVILHVPM